MSRPFPRKCATCRERAVQPATLPTYDVKVDHDGRSYDVILHDVGGTRCGHCQTLILDDSVDDRIDAELRRLAGLLQPAEIRGHREALKLTQKALAQALRVGEATLSRWETGAQIQQRSMDLLLRLFFDIAPVRHYAGLISTSAEELPGVERGSSTGIALPQSSNR